MDEEDDLSAAGTATLEDHDDDSGTTEVDDETTLETIEAVADEAGELGRRLAKVASGGSKRGAAGTLGRLSDVAGLVSATASPGSEESKVLDVIQEGAETVGDLLDAARGVVAAYQLVERALDDENDSAGEQAVAAAQQALSREPGELRMEFVLEGSGVDFRVERFVWHEKISEPYLCEVEVTSEEELPAELGTLLGKPASLTLERGGTMREVRGIVAEMEGLGTDNERTSARLVLRPGLFLQSLGRRSRVFQNKTALDIVREVLTQPVLEQGRDVQVLGEDLSPVREYTVQYQESDLGFVSRLLAEEGYSYWLDHDAEEETILIGAQNDDFDPIGAFDLRSRSDLDAQRVGVVELHRRTLLRSTTHRVTDHNWFGVQTIASRRVSLTEPPAEDGGYTHAHDAPLRFGGYTEDGTEATSNLDRVADLALKRERLLGHDLSGTGDVLAFSPGQTARIGGEEYALMSVIHRGRREGAVAEPGYENQFSAVPSEVAVVPSAPVGRPRVPGYLTATVTGPGSEPDSAAEGGDGSESAASEEIFSDKYGRVKVRFHWDQAWGSETKSPAEHSSCWLRVAQGWAGPGFGSLFIPRVGMEVVVQFEGGNPDRPLCTGCVHNRHNPPPAQLPREMDHTVLRTSSTPDGEGFNELRFIDGKGSEAIQMHAHRNHSLEVGEDETVSVGNKQSVTVGADRQVEVTGDQRRTVKGVASDIFETGHGVHVSGGDATTEVSAGAWTTEAVTLAQVKVGEELLSLAPSTVSLTSTNSIRLVVGGATAQLSLSGVELSMGAAKVALREDSLHLEVGGSFIELRDSGIKIEGAKVRATDGSSTVELSGSGASLTSSSEVTIKGSKVQMN